MICGGFESLSSVYALGDKDLELIDKVPTAPALFVPANSKYAR